MALLDAPSPDTLLATLSARAGDPGLVHVERLPARGARFAEPEQPIARLVEAALRARGIDRLWSHQAEAIDQIRAGCSAVVATGTASGKSLCYQIPIAE